MRGRKAKQQETETKTRKRGANVTIVKVGAKKEPTLDLEIQETPILHLPISKGVVDSLVVGQSVEQQVLSYSPTINNPQPILSNPNLSFHEQLEYSKPKTIKKQSVEDIKAERQKQDVEIKSGTITQEKSQPSRNEVPEEPESFNKDDFLIENEEENYCKKCKSRSLEVDEIQFVNPAKTVIVGKGKRMNVYPVISWMQNREIKNGVWPKKVAEWCWWCCHSFDSPPVALPERLDTLSRKWYVRGNFCSFNCCKAYGYAKSDLREHTGSMIDHFFFTLTGERKQITIAPPREALQVFGGPFTIEQFRSKFTTFNDYILFTMPCIPLKIQMQEMQSTDDQTFEPEPPKENLRRKRSKAIPSQTIGISSFAKL